MWALLTGMALFAAWLMKASTIILAVAMVLYCIIRWGKRAARPVLCMAGALVALLLCWQVVLRSDVLIDYEGVAIHKVPAQHYIMMGLTGNGGYNPGDEQFSLSFPDLASRKAGEIAVIKQRLQEYGLTDLMGHLRGKIAYTWGDGAYYAHYKLAQGELTQSPLQAWIHYDGAHHAVFAAVVNAPHFLLLASLAWFSVRGAVAKRPRANLLFLCLLAIFGLALFLLVWETRSRYLVSFAPLYTVVLATAAVWVEGRLARRAKKART